MAESAVYKIEEVAALLRVSPQELYEMPVVQGCRIKGLGKRRVRYSKAKIDALLAGADPRAVA